MVLQLDAEGYRAAHAALRPAPLPIEQPCREQLQHFTSHSLDDQLQVNLADRTDSKYLMPLRLLPRFLQALTVDHTVLEASGCRISTYENTYFDTPDWSLYRAHHNGKLNRYKCRFRRYRETDIAYLEVKLKSNKLRTVKNRVPLNGSVPALDLPLPGSIAPSLYINYRRMSFWNRQTNERLTVDFDLNYRRPQQAATVRVADVFVAELKREGKVYGSPFVRRAKAYGYTPQPVSKFCLGVCLTDSGQLKSNRFKPLLRTLHKVQNTGAIRT